MNSFQLISAFKAKKQQSNAATNGATPTPIPTTTTTTNSTSNNVGNMEPPQPKCQNGIVGITVASSSSNSSSSSSNGGVKKKPVAQDNAYQYLRHIREIETANKLLSPVVMLNTDDHNLVVVNGSGGSATGTNAGAGVVGVGCAVDVVDHCAPATVRLSSDLNMNGSSNIGKSSSSSLSTSSPTMENVNGNVDSSSSLSSLILNGDDDDISEHSMGGATGGNSTSSSSEHSNSTVVHSPTIAQITSNPPAVAAAASHQRSLNPSPARSLTLSFGSNSSVNCVSSLTLSSLGIADQPQQLPPLAVCCTNTSTTSSNQGDVDGEVVQTPLGSPVVKTSSSSTDDYVPAFLKSVASPVTLPIIMPNGSSGLSTTSSAASTPKHTRYSKPRLSLSRVFNHSMPSVHGRPNLSLAPPLGEAGSGIGGAGGGVTNSANPPKRISTHQRNLSLDFRSMGILLPPVSQVTNTRINHTQHHRNRSLDSALQRIPEVEVSSPNAESENTFCSPSSILGTNMCSKIVTTAANVTAALSPTTPTPAVTTSAPTPATNSSVPVTAATAAVHHQHQHQHQLPNVVVESCPTLRLRPKSSEGQDMSIVVLGSSGGGSGSNTASSNNSCSSGSSSSKKREDLTSLGSDDSGIICGSESDQISLNRIRHSHESLDSGEMDADADGDADGEEECIDMIETTSMDEDYNLMQADLCFYPQHTTSDLDCRTLRPSRKQKQQRAQEQASLSTQPLQQQQQQHLPDQGRDNSVENRMRYRVMNMSQAAINMERGSAPNEIEPVLDDDDDGGDNDDEGGIGGNNVQSSTSSPPPPVGAVGSDVVDAAVTTPTAATTTTLTTPVATPTPTENPKNDQVLFKNFFGATKNAIFRTAQSIIENHEKKHAAKQKTGGDQDNATVNSTVSTPSGVGAASPQDQVKSPTDISKKKEFFSLLTSSKKAAAAAAAAAAISAANTPAATPTTDATPSLQSPNAATEGRKERTLNLRLPGAECEPTTTTATTTTEVTLPKSSSVSSLQKLRVPVPGVVKYFINERTAASGADAQKSERGPSGLLRFFESPVFNIHFAVHYLFYSKEPGVLSFIGNKIFSFPDQEVDLYIPQLIVMYIQMDELAEVLDPYLTIRCRKSVDFSLKCLWLLEAYNYQVDTLGSGTRKSKLALMKEIFSKKENKLQAAAAAATATATTNKSATALVKKTHHRSQSDATVLLADSRSPYTLSITHRMYQQPPYTTQTLPATPAKLCLGDLTSGRAFDNGCTCFETVRGQVNGLLGQRTFCSCGAPKTAPQKEFMRALMNVGRNLTSLPSKAEKTSALRMFLNLINKNLPARVWLPLYSDIPHHVVRITEEKTAVLNSKDKTPYIIYVEVVEVPEIYTSPLIPKMMPSLRHTKSEEHLEGACLNQRQSCSRTSSCSSSHHGSSCRRNKQQQTDAGCGDSHNNCTMMLGGLHLHEDDVWSQEDDEITAQYLNMRKISERDAISQMSLDSCDSRDQGPPVVFNIGDVRTRHCNNLSCENTKSFSNDPEDPSAAALKEPWDEKEKLIRESSPYGHLSNWRLLSAIVKCGDDLRQELMATQLLQMFKIIWQEEHVDLWVRPYKIICLSNDSGIIEPILNTVSLHQIKKNSSKSLRDYFIDEYGKPDGENFRRAQKNFVQSCAAYCLISYLLQVKDRHNGNILFHSDGHIIHIDFGFILSISPKNLGFEQSPFKLTHEFVDVMGGTNSEHWREFNRLLLVGMMSARKHMDRIINFVEIMRSNAQLPCFKNGCSGTVQNLRKRFHMNLTEQEMERKIEQLVQDSLKSLSTKLYDGYQYYTNGIL